MPGPLPATGGIPHGVDRLIGVGIQSAQGLIWYLKSLNERGREIGETISRVESLLQVLKQINDVLSCTRVLVASKGVLKCLKDSEEKLEELNRFILELRGAVGSSPNLKEKIKDIGRTLSFPFSRDKLDSLHGSLRDLLSHLELGIGVTTLESNISIKASLSNVEAGLQSSNDELKWLHSRTEENSDKLSSTEALLTKVAANLEQQLDRTEVAIRNIEDWGNEINARMTVVQCTTQSTALVNQATAEGVTELLHRMGQLETLSSQMSLQLSHSQYQQPSYPSGGSYQHVSRRKNSKKAICSCRTGSTPSRYSFSWWSLEFHCEEYQRSEHDPDCKYYGIKQASKRKMSLEFQMKMGWLSQKILKTSLDLTTGTGNPGISINFKNIVPWATSPVQIAIEDLGNELYLSGNRKMAIKRIELFERSILSMYRDGIASPSDRDEFGRSHIELFFDLSQLDSLWDTAFNDKAITDSLMQLITTLAGTMLGFDDVNIIQIIREFQVNWVYEDDSLTEEESETCRTVVSSVISAFPDVVYPDPMTVLGHKSSGPLKFRAHTNELRFPLQEAVVEAFDPSPFMRAIMSHSIEGLKHALSQDPQAPLREKITMKELLQMCETWPSGWRLLMEGSAKDILFDSCADTENALALLDKALSRRNAHATDSILDTGCPLEFNQNDISNTSRECWEVLASHVAQRRRELVKLGQEELDMFLELNLSETVGDRHAAYICQELSRFDIEIPPTLWVSQQYISIYHLILPHQYPIFYEKGFKDLGLCNDLGLTPIMTWYWDSDNESPLLKDWDPEVLQWLQQYGCLDQTPKDPGNIGLNESATGLHYLIAKLATKSLWLDLSLNPKSSQAAGIALRSTCSDNCVCWCNVGGGGCLPVTFFFKVFLNDRVGYCGLISGLSEFLENIGAPVFANALVRLLTFETLEMTHTCCRPETVDRLDLWAKLFKLNGQYLGPTRPNHAFMLVNADLEHPEEIRADVDEQWNAQLLDMLMAEFAPHLNSLKTHEDLDTFFRGTWRRRMSEIMDVDPEIVSQMEQLVGPVKTYVLPRTVGILLGWDFRLLRPEFSPPSGSPPMASHPPTSKNESDDDFEPPIGPPPGFAAWN